MHIRRAYWRSSVAVVIALLGLIGVAPKALAAEPGTPQVLALNQTVDGKTYSQLSAEWWQYAFLRVSFENCPDEPQGDVWFLAGTLGGSPTRSCTIPAGKFIMFPVFNIEWSVAEAQAEQSSTNRTTSCFVHDIHGNLITGTGDASLLACATAQAKHALGQDASLKAKVDGKKLKDLADFEVASPPFDFTTVAGNPFGLCGDFPGAVSSSCPLTSHAEADGFWIILLPLSPGEHTIRFAATVPFEDVISPSTSFTFATDETYHLMVQPSVGTK